MLPLTYVGSLLEQVKMFVGKRYGEALRENPHAALADFSEFARICRLVEEQQQQQPQGQPTERKKGVQKRDNSPSAAGQQSRAHVKTDSPQSGKKKRDWGGKVDKDTMESLDFSADKDKALLNGTAPSPMAPGDLVDLKDLAEQMEESPVPRAGSTGIWGYLERLTGQKEVTAEALSDAIGKMREHLIQKNVAAEVANVICASVSEEVLGKRTGPFFSTSTSLASLVGGATEAAVSRILLPRGAPDLLVEVEALRRREGRPFVVAFVGVNGVGKSTNLSKVAFWLMQSGLRVLLVAGDTFRSGAVEQLRTHCRNLSAGRLGTVELYERGYGRDAAAVAREAIAHGRRESFDVVMIDTAGRMQDNVQLMGALAKLVALTAPDKLIFVGEALVGNEAVDQLKKFNGALKAYVGPEGQTARAIDGILLTKFDAIDDKVGAALSMTYIAKAPILFVGIGQTYTDLRKLNVKSVVNSLLK